MLKTIKSNLIMKAIFKNIHNKIKLKIIKYSKYMLRRLDIKKENFKSYEILKEFNEKLKLNIIDIDIKELNLNRKDIGNKELELLKNLDFGALEKLDLSFNKISDIKVLENVNFKGLQKLDLSCNKISDIKVLENVNFKELKELYLDGNPINYDSTFVENLKSKINIYY